jgi:hypothetical protein
MPRAAAVIRYPGKRGTVWKIKYADADGRQVKETLGPERDGWTRQKAEAELRERLVRVERRSYRRPKPLTFGEYAETWFTEGRLVAGGSRARSASTGAWRGAWSSTSAATDSGRSARAISPNT